MSLSVRTRLTTLNLVLWRTCDREGLLLTPEAPSEKTDLTQWTPAYHFCFWNFVSIDIFLNKRIKSNYICWAVNSDNQKEKLNRFNFNASIW